MDVRKHNKDLSDCSFLDGVHLDSERRYWIERLEASEDNCDIEEDMG